jgi:hypothetical protein
MDPVPAETDLVSATSELPLPARVRHRFNFPRSTGTILAIGKNGGRLGNYGDPAAAISDLKLSVGRLPPLAFGSNVARATSARTESPSRRSWPARRIIETCDYNLIRSQRSLGRLSVAKHVSGLVMGKGGERPDASAARKRGAEQECVRHRHPFGRPVARS